MLLFIILFIYFQLINGLKIINQFIEEPKDFESLVGSTIILRCRTQIINENQVTWCKNDFCTLGKTRDLPFYPRYEIIGDVNRGEHHFKITNFSSEDVGLYQCQIRPGYRTSPALSRKAKLTLLQIPTNISIDHPIELIENIPSNIICRSNNAMPEAQLSWILPKSINYFSINHYVLINEKSLRNSISNLTLLPKRSFHRQLIQCQANSSAIHLLNQTIITQQFINIFFKPEVKIEIKGQLIENETIELICEIESRPKYNEIHWFNGTQQLIGYNKRNVSLLLNRSMHQNQIICQVTNSIGRTNQSIILNITYRPRFIDQYGNQLKTNSIKLVNENETIHLECFIDSYPLSMIFWIFNQNILLINETSLIIKEFSIKEHLGSYQCYVQHSVFGNFSRIIRLILKNPPEFLSNQFIYSQQIGQTIEIICLLSTDLPVEEIIWFKQNQIRIESNEKYKILEKRTNEFIENKLIIRNVLIFDQGKYFCQAKNHFGTSTKSFQLNIEKNFIYFIRKTSFYFLFFIFICLFTFLIIYLIKYRFNLSKTNLQHQFDQQIILQQSLIQNHIQDLLNNVDEHHLHYSKTYSTIV